MSVNKVILVGNVGKDPETKYLENNLVVSKFPLATSETYKNKNGESVTNTEWHNVVLWRGLAEMADKYITKGKQLYVEGRIKTRSYDDASGNKRYITEIYGDVVQMLGRKGEVNSGGNAPSHSANDAPAEKDSTPFDNEDFNGSDDLPF